MTGCTGRSRLTLLSARALVAVLVLSLAVLVSAGPVSAAPMASTPLITWNMQGANSGGDSKWTTTVGAYARAAEIVALQEVGPTPPGTMVANYTFNAGAPGRSGYVQHNRWQFGLESYEVYFLQTDANGGSYVGGRTNVALVTQRPADEVRVIPNANGRNVLGVRFGDNWYFTFHGQSMGGAANDSAAMAQQIATSVNTVPGRHWTMLGDFNVAPRSFFAPAGSYWYHPGTATQQSGGELDWALSSENLPGHPVMTVPGSSSDHYAVAIGTMRAQAEPTPLRIMPLGDSITYGANTTIGAYRGPLYDELRANGTTVDYVGSRRYGAIPDADNEGYPQWKIADIAGITDNALTTYKPNVVLLHIGTNDMNENVDPAGAPARLGSLIDQIFRKQPDVTLVVSTLVPAVDPAVEGRIFEFNNSLPGVVAQRQNAGRRVWLVDMDPVSTADLADLLHPNDNGYRKMADVFAEGLRSVGTAGWISPPAGDPGGNPPGGPVRGWLPQGVVAAGTASSGSAPGNLTMAPGDQVHFADINGDNRADYLLIHTNGTIDQWINGGVAPDGAVAWTSPRTVNLRRAFQRDMIWHFPDLDGDGVDEMVALDPVMGGQYFSRADGGFFSDGWGAHVEADTQYLYADLDGDGWADHIHVRGDGSVEAALRLHTGWDGRPFGDEQVVASGVGSPGNLIRFADLNGDGRADYLVVSDDGAIRAWINGGRNGSSWAWYPVGTVATGVGVPSSQVRLADIDGDGRPDYLAVNPLNGDIRMWRNAGTDTVNWPWLPRGSITAGTSSRVLYADIDGDRRADYLQVNNDSSVQAWLNGGPKPGGGDYYWTAQGTIAGGVGVAGSSVRFADLNGDRRADFVVVGDNSSMRAWLNGGPKASGGDWAWIDQGTIAIGVGAAGGSVRLADLDGDRRADYIVVGDDSSVRAWLNGGPNPAGGDYLWTQQGTIAGGVGAAGGNVRFADLTGDGRADFVVVRDDSGVDLWMNGGPKTGEWYWTPQGTVASGVLVAGNRIQFADIDGDARADYLEVDSVTGATRAWLNMA
ncbi:FG-GAP-like repeat-containing protein [Micromonospora orduensis]|uniref:FG-GAP-like repeat-containing protein n=1 Tax=Micromonospora orduensis TaxID=1420891 RepID=UPI0037F5D999